MCGREVSLRCLGWRCNAGAGAGARQSAESDRKHYLLIDRDVQESDSG